MKLEKVNKFIQQLEKKTGIKIIRCPYCGCFFEKKGEGLQSCPTCGSELLA